MSLQKGSVFGGALLITASCIGAGMLGLPILLGRCGFFLSLLLLFLAWGFMTYTSLLLVEVMAASSVKANIVTLSRRTLGNRAKVFTGIIYLFLFYSLLVAYVSGSGEIIHSILGKRISVALGSVFFTLLFGVLIYFGKQIVDYFNRFLMGVKVLSFVGLIVLAFSHFNPKLLLHYQPIYALAAFPILVISFGFQNMNPVLMEYLGGDIRRVKRAIFLGSGAVLLFYLFWIIVVLGVLPVHGRDGIIETLKNNRQATQALSGIIKSPLLTLFAQGFAFVALLTSFLAQALGMVHFLADWIQIKSRGSQESHRENALLCLLTLAPPLICSLINPYLFYQALSFAGGICAVILFGALPVFMVWKMRYVDKAESTYRVFGEKAMLSFIFLFALLIFLFELGNMLHLSFLKTI